jgi:hypothetical protein
MRLDNVRSLVRRPVPILRGMLALLMFTGSVSAQNPSGERRPAVSSTQQPFVVEYYYQVRWGFAEEFIRLFRKNHFPVLQKQIESGRLVSVTAGAPRYHATEDRRWDYRVTIVFRNAQVASEADPNLDAIVRQLYPDQNAFRAEEQRRFEILIAHWDVPTVSIDLTRP